MLCSGKVRLGSSERNRSSKLPAIVAGNDQGSVFLRRLRLGWYLQILVRFVCRLHFLLVICDGVGPWVESRQIPLIHPSPGPTYLSIDYGFGNSSAAAGMYAIHPNGTVFKTRERVERKMSALEFAKRICKDGFPKAEYPVQGPQTPWLKKLKARDPEKPRMSFCVMDPAMDQHHGTRKSVYTMISEVMSEHDIGSIKGAHDPAGNAQVLYNGLSNKLCILTRESSDLPLSYRSISSRIVDERKAIKKIHGVWEDDVYDETAQAYNTWRQNSEKPARTALQDELAQMRKDGMDESSLARIAWNREQAILSEERTKAKAIRLSRSLDPPARKP